MERPIYDYSPPETRRVGDMAGPPPQTGQDLQQIAQDQIKAWMTQLGNIVSQNPGASLGAALGMGVVLGWLIKRR